MEDLKVLITIFVPTILSSYLAITYDNIMMGLLFGLLSAHVLLLIFFWDKIGDRKPRRKRK